MLKPESVLVVCEGNVYRSPLCAAVLRTRLPIHSVRSRGVGCEKDRPAALLCRKVGYLYREHVHYSLQRHRSTPLTNSDIEWASTIIYMDERNRRGIVSRLGGREKRLLSLGSLGDVERVPDPAFLPEREAREVLQSVVEYSLLFLGGGS